MSKKSAHLLRHSDTSARDGSMPWLSRMFLHEFLEQLTQMTDKDLHEVCRKPESRMAGKKLYSDTHDDCLREESAHTTATQGHSNPHPDITTSFHKKSEKSDAQCLFDLGNFLNEDSKKSGGILPRGFDEETRRTGLLLPTRRSTRRTFP